MLVQLARVGCREKAERYRAGRRLAPADLNHDRSRSPKKNCRNVSACIPTMPKTLMNSASVRETSLELCTKASDIIDYTFGFLGWLFDRVDLDLKCPPVCVHMHLEYVRPFTKRFFDFNEIWHAGRGQWMVHNGMQYDPIQSQGQGHEPFKFGNADIFKGCFLHHLQWELAADHWFLN